MLFRSGGGGTHRLVAGRPSHLGQLGHNLAREADGVLIADQQEEGGDAGQRRSEAAGAEQAAGPHVVRERELEQRRHHGLMNEHTCKQGADQEDEVVGLEGGGVEVNGQGLLIANARLWRNRNRALSLEAIESQLLALPATDTDALHVKLQDDISALTAYVGDISNLILDPDLDSYYLMEGVLLKLPDAADLLLQARLLTQNAATAAPGASRGPTSRAGWPPSAGTGSPRRPARCGAPASCLRAAGWSGPGGVRRDSADAGA